MWLDAPEADCLGGKSQLTSCGALYQGLDLPLPLFPSV